MATYLSTDLRYGIPVWIWKDYPHVMVLGFAVGIVLLMALCMGNPDAKGARSRKRR